MMKAWKRCEADCWRPWNYGRVASALCFSWFPLANVWLFLASKNVWLFLLMIGNARCQNCAGWRCFGAQNCTYLNRVWLNLVSVNLGSEHPYRGLLTLLFWKGDKALDATMSLSSSRRLSIFSVPCSCWGSLVPLACLCSLAAQAMLQSTYRVT